MLTLRASVSTHVRTVATATQNYIRLDLTNLEKKKKNHWPEEKEGQNGPGSMISSVSAIKCLKGFNNSLDLSSCCL